MNELKVDTEKQEAMKLKEIRAYFSPADKAYLKRMEGFLIYCAFLVIPATAAFLGQFRTGAAFIAIFMAISQVMPWVRYFQFLKAIKEEWLSKEEQEALQKDFAEAASVFKGDARIGKKYTFFRKERAIVPTKDVKGFNPFRARSGVVIMAELTDGNKTVTKIKYYKDMMPDLQALLDEAKNSLQDAADV